MKFTSALFLTAASTAIFSTPVFAQSYQELTPDKCNSGIPLKTYNGQLTTIDFSPSQQKITYIGLSDRSRHTLNTDVPLESGQAQAVFILPIQKLDFPGATTSPNPNLVLRTINDEGVTQTCNFLISTHLGKMDTLGIKFIPSNMPDVPVAQSAPEAGSFKVSFDRTATPDDLEAGLEIAIARGLTTFDDPVTSQVRNLAFQLRNGTELQDALAETGTPPEVAQKVAEINLDLPPKQLERPIIPEQAKNTREVTEQIYLGQELLLKLHAAVERKEISRNSEEYQNIKQTIAEIRRGKNPSQAGLDNNLSPQWQNWLEQNT